MNGINAVNNQSNKRNPLVIAWVRLLTPLLRGSLGQWAFLGFVGPKANGAHMVVAANPHILGGATVVGFHPSLLNRRLNTSQHTG